MKENVADKLFWSLMEETDRQTFGMFVFKDVILLTSVGTRTKDAVPLPFEEKKHLYCIAAVLIQGTIFQCNKMGMR